MWHKKSCTMLYLEQSRVELIVHRPSVHKSLCSTSKVWEMGSICQSKGAEVVVLAAARQYHKSVLQDRVVLNVGWQFDGEVFNETLDDFLAC